MEKLIKANHMTRLNEQTITSDTQITELKEQWKESCESDKKDHANKMKVKHSEEIDKIRQEIVDDHQQKA